MARLVGSPSFAIAGKNGDRFMASETADRAQWRDDVQDESGAAGGVRESAGSEGRQTDPG